MNWFVVQFDCSEAILCQADIASDLALIRDGRGCTPRAIYPLSDVQILSEWKKDGYHRVEYQLLIDRA